MFTLDQMLKPIWNTDIVYGESFTMYRDKNGEISGKADEIEYKLTVSPTGLPQKLELDSRHITVKFYNISIKEE